jgi:Tfp pilus assembly protein PilV
MVAILLIAVGLLLLASLWAMCKAASDADATAEWNKNWVGQKFDKERKDETD